MKNKASNSPKYFDLTKEQILSRFTFDKETGIFRFRSDEKRKKAGDIAGFKTIYGYIQIAFGKKRYFAHRLAWVVVYGKWPETELDHINRIRDDNRIENLRITTHSINLFNQKLRADNKSGYRRVSLHRPTGKWTAHITAHGKSKYLGYFDDPKDAYAAYMKARADLLGDQNIV